jgi:hypothetical protein
MTLSDELTPNGSVYRVGGLQLEMKHLESIAKLISPISIEFTSLVAEIYLEMPLREA